MSDWYMMIPLMVFTKIKQKFSQEIKDEYGMSDINFTSQRSNDAVAVFPLVFVNAMPAAERGADLYGGAVNGALFTFQVDVYDNQTQTRARKVMAEVANIMKSMGFEIISMPNFDGAQNNTHRMTARFRRVIGANDKFMN